MGKKRLPSLRDLNFGLLDAKEEADDLPELLKSGYYDHRSAALNLALGDGWLMLGPKGAGKSAAFEHLRLTWSDDPNKFYGEWNLGSFPVGDVTNMQVGASAGPSSNQAAWEFLLFLKIFESLLGDEGSYPNAQVLGLKRDLMHAGLIGGPDLRTKFFDWTKTTAKVQVAGFGAEGAFTDSSATVIQLLEILKKACSCLTTPSQHLLAVDGLDLFFVERDEQFRSLAALVHAVSSVNAFFKRHDIRATVAVAMRSDVFDVLPSTDSAKLRSHAVHLDWSDSETGTRSFLWDLADQKVKASAGQAPDLLPIKSFRTDYLSTAIGVGRFTNIPDYLIAHTRMLPRDLIALLSELREAHPGATPVTQAEAKLAVRRYSETYFVAEIMNNLAGALPDQSAEKVVAFRDALASLEGRYFTAKDLSPELDGLVSTLETRKLLKQMYEVGGLGIMRGTAPHRHTNFIYRRSGGAAFSALAEYNLHNALVEAWNIPR